MRTVKAIRKEILDLDMVNEKRKSELQSELAETSRRRRSNASDVSTEVPSEFETESEASYESSAKNDEAVKSKKQRRKESQRLYRLQKAEKRRHGIWN